MSTKKISELNAALASDLSTSSYFLVMVAPGAGGTKKMSRAEMRNVVTGALATVATSGAYSDLTGKPTLGSAAALAAGSASGVATLDGSGKVPTAQLPAAVLGSLSYQGGWNANTNSPTIPAAASGNKGQYYVVGTAGATNVDGVTDWKIGDWIVSNGTTWDKIDNTDGVASVAGKTGVVTLVIADVSGLQAAIDAKAASSSLATVATSGAYNDLTGKPSLATVATSGAYNDLSGKPTLGTAAALDAGSAGGAATLDGSTGKLLAAQIPASLVGAVQYQGTWNANTNSPTIPAAASGNKGWYYKVGTAGSTTVDGTSEWKVGDWIISNGTTWDKIDNTDQVTSVAGKQGVVTLVIADTSGLQAALDAKQATISGGASTILTSNLTASRVLVSDGSGKVGVSTVTSTEIGSLSGVTSGIQSQFATVQTKLDALVWPSDQVPNGLGAAMSGDDCVLTWTNNNDYATVVEVYKDDVLLANVAGDATTYNDAGVIGTDVHVYKVRARWGYILSPFSSDVPVDTSDPYWGPDELTHTFTWVGNGVTAGDNDELGADGSSPDNFSVGTDQPGALTLVSALVGDVGGATGDKIHIWSGEGDVLGMVYSVPDLVTNPVTVNTFIAPTNLMDVFTIGQPVSVARRPYVGP